MRIEFIHHGPPVPASRPRVTRFGTYTDKKYSKYKKALTKALFEEFGYFCWDFPPPGSKERSKWLKNNRYKLTVLVYRETRRGDWDNFGKSVSDALQDAGLVADDEQIDSAHIQKFDDKKNPRIHLILESI